MRILRNDGEAGSSSKSRSLGIHVAFFFQIEMERCVSLYTRGVLGSELISAVGFGIAVVEIPVGKR